MKEAKKAEKEKLIEIVAKDVVQEATTTTVFVVVDAVVIDAQLF